MTTEPRRNGKNTTRDRYRATVNVLTEVMEERAAQDRTWGEQNHPLHSTEDPWGLYLLGRTYSTLEQMAKQRFAGGERSGALILLEEVFEALAAKDLVSARNEMVQVAAVAVMIVESIDRARRNGSTAADRKGNVRPCDVIASPLVTGAADAKTFPTVQADSDHPRGWDGSQVRHAEIDTVPDIDAFDPIGPCVIEPADPDCDAGVCDHTSYSACLVEIPTCGADGCTDAYCPGGSACRVHGAAHPRADLVTTHPYNGAGRLHGICRCGEGPDHPVHRLEEDHG